MDDQNQVPGQGGGQPQWTPPSGQPPAGGPNQPGGQSPWQPPVGEPTPTPTPEPSPAGQPTVPPAEPLAPEPTSGQDEPGQGGGQTGGM